MITEAAFTDLVRLPTEPAWPIDGDPLAGPRWSMRHYVLASFGPRHLWWWSPIRLAARIRAQLLMGSSQFDSAVPQQQIYEMRAARPDLTKTMLLQGGTAPFTHAGISPAALAAWRHAELRLLHQTIRRRFG